jgi:pyridoxamine 5'-phosphate oxidase
MLDQRDEMPMWRRQLEASLADAGDATAWFVQLATLDQDHRPANRTVVVRRILPETGDLIITTDARSQKITHLRAAQVRAAHVRPAPDAALCWYLLAARQQFRIRGKVTIVDDAAPSAADQALRRQLWQDLGPRTQQTFYGPPPGAPRAAHDASGGALPDDDAAPPDSFALLILTPEAVDHLDLNYTPHRRTVYRRQPDGAWTAEPITP